MNNKIIDLIIDLTFDKHCKVKEVAYQENKLVCDNLDKLKQELKNNLKEVLEND